MNLRNNIRGMTMLEIVISLFIIGIAATIASTMIISLLQGNRVNKNKLIAISLAREGIEAVRNIRDSNWLRYKANLDECWNFWENPEETTPITTCNTTSLNRITAGYYTVNIGRNLLGPSFTPSSPPYTYKWYLTDATNQSDIETLTGANLDEYELELLNTGSYNIYVAQSHPSGAAMTSPFYRQIQIEYIDTDKNGTADVDDESLKVISTVVWFEKGQKKKVKFMSQLSNYME